MAKAATKKEVSVAEKLEAIYALQKIDSQIDQIRIIRGELPLEVEDLGDAVAGLETRISKIKAEVKEVEQEISDSKNSIKDFEAQIKKYKEQQGHVRNDREYESLESEIELKSLDIKLNEKKNKEAKFKITSKKEKLEAAEAQLVSLKEEYDTKKAELDKIVAETQKDEDALIEKSDKAREGIEERLLSAYDRLRKNAHNGLAVVTIDRDSCGGCFNHIPPQRQLDIQAKRRIIVCEHCGRIIVPFTEESQE